MYANRRTDELSNKLNLPKVTLPKLCEKHLEQYNVTTDNWAGFESVYKQMQSVWQTELAQSICHNTETIHKHSLNVVTYDTDLAPEVYVFTLTKQWICPESQAMSMTFNYNGQT